MTSQRIRACARGRSRQRHAEQTDPSRSRGLSCLAGRRCASSAGSAAADEGCAGRDAAARPRRAGAVAPRRRPTRRSGPGRSARRVRRHAAPLPDSAAASPKRRSQSREQVRPEKRRSPAAALRLHRGQGRARRDLQRDSRFARARQARHGQGRAQAGRVGRSPSSSSPTTPAFDITPDIRSRRRPKARPAFPTP